MNDVINFFFDLLESLWSLIISHWILSMGFALMVISWVVDLVNSTRQS